MQTVIQRLVAVLLINVSGNVCKYQYQKRCVAFFLIRM